MSEILKIIGVEMEKIKENILCVTKFYAKLINNKNSDALRLNTHYS